MTRQILKSVSFLIVFFTAAAPSAFCQQMPLYSQYMFNRFLINPAIAGLDGYTTVNLTAREQWLGLKNSPKTHSVSAQTRLLPNNFITKVLPVHRKPNVSSRGGRVGLGVNVFNDKSGIINRTGFQFTYAYHLPFEESELSFGLTASAHQFSINRQNVVTDTDDKLISRSSLNIFTPDFSLGLFYTANSYYGGISVNQLFQSAIQFGQANNTEYRLSRHNYIMGGYIYQINRNLSFEPSLLLKVTNTATQLDLSAKINFRTDYWGAISLRTGSAFILMGGITVDNYSFGYAFDYNLNSIRRHSFGSHEIMLAIKFGDNARRYRWLHRF